MTQNKKMTNDSGRSMVEMLGVLAVIGVLSIAGVAGYTTAMNKHRANEILNGASVRAVVVSTQLQKNKDATPTLAEFGTESVQGVTFGEPAKMGEKQFKIPLTGSGLTAAVCSQLKNIAGDDGSGTVRVVSDCSRFVYNNDLSKGVTDAGNTNKENDGSCKAGTYGSDCENVCTGNTEVNTAGTGCQCKTGWSSPGCTECDSTKNYIEKDSTCVKCPGTSTICSGAAEAEAVPDYEGCYCPSGQTWKNNECKSAQKEFYITGPTDHYDAAQACSDLEELGGGWTLATLSDYFEAIGGKTECSYIPREDGVFWGNNYEECPYTTLNFANGSRTIDDVFSVWLAECWESNDGGNGTTCPSDSDDAWFADDGGDVFYNYRGDSSFYVLCVR